MGKLDKISSYENKVGKNYGDLGNSGEDAKNWGTMLKDGRERFNGYTDRRFIEQVFIEPINRWLAENKIDRFKIADFGGDDGFLLNTILQSVKEGVTKYGYVVDIDSTGKARIKFKEKHDSKDRENIEYVVSDVVQTPFDDESLDVVVSRFTMQYLDEENQDLFLKEVSRVLRKGGLFELVTITESQDNEGLNKIFMEITAIISGSQDFKRKFPVFGAFSKRRTAAHRYNLRASYGSRLVDFPFSVEAFAERFKLTDDQIEILYDLYKRKSEEYKDLFSMIDGTLCLMARLLEVRFIKV